MCRQAWFVPGDSARDVHKLAEFLDQLERSCGGHGNGAGYVDLASGEYGYRKAVAMTVRECAEIIARRPQTAWGVFHTRLASAGARDDVGCHPHVYESRDAAPEKRRLVVLTHNGTWIPWRGACVALHRDYPTDSATVAALVALHGWRIAKEIGETIVAAIRCAGKWSIRAWRNHYPLVLLANGGIASEGGTGEFQVKAALAAGGHKLTGRPSVRTEPLPPPKPVVRCGNQDWLERLLHEERTAPARGKWTMDRTDTWKWVSDRCWGDDEDDTLLPGRVNPKV